MFFRYKDESRHFHETFSWKCLLSSLYRKNMWPWKGENNVTFLFWARLIRTLGSRTVCNPWCRIKWVPLYLAIGRLFLEAPVIEGQFRVLKKCHGKFHCLIYEMLWNSDPVSNTQSDYSLFNLQHSIFLFNDLLFFLVFIEHVCAIFLWFDSDARERNWET